MVFDSLGFWRRRTGAGAAIDHYYITLFKIDLRPNAFEQTSHLKFRSPSSVRCEGKYAIRENDSQRWLKVLRLRRVSKLYVRRHTHTHTFDPNMSRHVAALCKSGAAVLTLKALLFSA
jgi:hypothetical protein